MKQHPYDGCEPIWPSQDPSHHVTDDELADDVQCPRCEGRGDLLTYEQPLDQIEIPRQVLEAARTLENWFKLQGCSYWKLMGVQSRVADSCSLCGGTGRLPAPPTKEEHNRFPKGRFTP